MAHGQHRWSTQRRAILESANLENAVVSMRASHDNPSSSATDDPPADDRAQLRSELAHLRGRMQERTSELEQKIEELAVRNADLDSFAHAAAHDLRAPVRTILGYSELAREVLPAEGTEEAVELLLRIEAACERMATTVDSLLDFASSGRSEVSFGIVDLDAVAATVLADHEIDLRGVTVETGALGSAYGHGPSVAQVLANLVSNAIKYSAEKSTIDIHATRVHPGHIDVSVVDNGVGFDPTRAEEIFEPFKRLTQTAAAGSGVGLAIARRLVLSMGGEIWAQSQPGEGSTFTFRLPTAPR